jgi:hypothetical protein
MFNKIFYSSLIYLNVLAAEKDEPVGKKIITEIQKAKSLLYFAFNFLVKCNQIHCWTC